MSVHRVERQPARVQHSVRDAFIVLVDDAFAQPRRHHEPLVVIEVYRRRQRQAVAASLPGLAQPELLGSFGRTASVRVVSKTTDVVRARQQRIAELSHCLSHAT